MRETPFDDHGFRHLIDSIPSWAPTLRLCDARAVYRSAVGLTSGTQPTMREMVLSMSIPRTFIHSDRGEPLRDPGGLGAAGVRIVAIPNAGHMMMTDNPTAFVAALVEALGGDEPAA